MAGSKGTRETVLVFETFKKIKREGERKLKKCLNCGVMHNNKKYCSRKCTVTCPLWLESLRGSRFSSLHTINLDLRLNKLLALVDGKSTYQDLIRKLGLEVCANSYTKLSKLFRILKERGLIYSFKQGRYTIYKKEEVVYLDKLEEINKIVKELTARLDAAIELLDNIHDGHSYYFDENDLRQLNYINGSDRYYIEEDDV